MSIEDMIARNCTDKCVYWESLGDDGYGGKNFAEPVEVDCRWENINQAVTDNKGTEITSRALVFITQDVEEEGMLFLGTISDLGITVGDSSLTVDNDTVFVDDTDITADNGGVIQKDPMKIEGSYIIKRFQKTPSLSGDGYLRKAYLTPS